MAAWLRSRNLDPEKLKQNDLARALPVNAAHPTWARYGGTWAKRGYQCVLPAWDDRGLATLRARRTDGGGGANEPKELAPKGYDAVGCVYANGAGSQLLTGKTSGEPPRIVIAEGAPDFLTWATLAENHAVFGVFSGAWTPEIAARIPDGAEVVVWTHDDKSGHEYAERVRSTLAPRCNVLRAPKPPRHPTGEPMDVNDMHRARMLPVDPFAGAVPMEEPRPETPDQAEAEAAFLSAAPTVGSLADDAVLRMMRRKTKEEKPVPLPWPALSEVVGGGLWPGLTVLVGGTGTGKSQLALQVAVHAAREGCPVLYIGLELGPIDVIARLVALLDQQKRYHWSGMYRGELEREDGGGTGPEDLGNVYDSVREGLSKLPIHLEFGGPYGWHYKLLPERVGALCAHYQPLLRDGEGNPLRPPLVVLDFLQVVASPPESMREDLRHRIQQAAYAGRAVAREHDAAVLLLSSTARAHYNTLIIGEDGGGTPLSEVQTNPAQFIGMGKESGEIEYGADTLITMLREPSNGATWRKVHLAVAKVRAGKPSHVELEFNGTRFQAEPRASEPVSPEALGF